MKMQELWPVLEELVEDSKTAVLATVDQENRPHTRWVVPGCLRNRPGALYTVSGSGFSKIEQLLNNPHAEMLFQTRGLEKIVNVSGRMNILDNPSIRSEVLECLGPRLKTFWKTNVSENDLVVLELVMEEAVYYVPVEGVREKVTF